MTTLNDLINLNPEAPALDPLIVDCVGMDIARFDQAIRDGIDTLTYRLKQSGFYSFKMLLVVNSILSVINDVQAFRGYPFVTLIPDEYTPEGIVYLLTMEADGRRIIHPPYNTRPPHDVMMWEEYFVKVMLGEPVKILVDIPWAQAKFINCPSSER